MYCKAQYYGKRKLSDIGNIIKRIAQIGRKEVSMAKNNYLQAGLDEIEPEAVQQIVTSLKEMHDLDRPQTDEEIKQRIDYYFDLCEHSSIRPGIESLCMVLHISKTTLFRWSKGEDCSEYKQELIEAAKSFIRAFLEQAMLSSKISLPSGIFLMKNCLLYEDTVSIEETIPQSDDRKCLSAKELPKLGGEKLEF